MKTDGKKKQRGVCTSSRSTCVSSNIRCSHTYGSRGGLREQKRNAVCMPLPFACLRLWKQTQGADTRKACLPVCSVCSVCTRIECDERDVKQRKKEALAVEVRPGQKTTQSPLSKKWVQTPGKPVCLSAAAARSAPLEETMETTILDVISADTRLTRVASTKGGEYAGPCPWC